MKIRRIFLVYSLFVVDVFFCTMNMFIDSNSTSLYLKYFAASYAVIVFSIFVFKYRYKYFTKPEAKSMALPLVLIFLYFPFVLIYGFNKIAFSSFQYLICFALPLTLLAIIANREDSISGIHQFVDYLSVLFFIYGLYVLKNGLLTNIVVRELQQESFIGYQSTSYYGAYLFGLGLYSLLFCTYKGERLGIIKKIYRITAVILGVVIGIYGSGKGAFVLIVTYSIVLIAMYYRKNRFSIKFVLIIFLILAILFVLSKIVGQFSSLQTSMDRILALFGTGGKIDYDTTSGRTEIYSRCFEIILDSPIIGHGLYSAAALIGQPHQMFLEVLIEGGIIYFVLWIMLLYRTMKRWLFLVRYDSENQTDYIFLLVVFLYQIIPVQFSGFYLQFGGMWFVIAYINLRFKKYIKSMEEMKWMRN